ncbi:MAG: hypothetical protein GYA24_18825 [Candidatus Lokiarchaeota archaeon]|nr:hypothetical protein [Candidatus Lokiarchaeota archaeon]
MYSPIGSEYTVTSRRDTHLIIGCPADKKLATKRMMGSFIAILVILSLYMFVLFGILGSMLFIMTPGLIVLPIVVMGVMGIFPASMYYTVSKLAKPFTVEFDKVSNKLQLCSPNPFTAFGYAKRNAYYNYGQYITIAWDLDKVVIRSCPTSEYSGPFAFSVKFTFKNRFIIVVTTSDWSYPVVFFASERAEVTQTLLGEIDRFLREGQAQPAGWQAPANEQPRGGRM